MLGPTLSERISRSQSMRWASVRCVVVWRFGIHAVPHGQNGSTGECGEGGRRHVRVRAKPSERGGACPIPGSVKAARPRREKRDDLARRTPAPYRFRRAFRRRGHRPIADASARRTRPSAPSSVATKMARAARTGPLRGIAVGIKDIIDTAGVPDRDGIGDLPGLAAARECVGRDARSRRVRPSSARPRRRRSRQTTRR